MEMSERDLKKKQIAKTFRRLRGILGWSQKELIERSGGTLHRNEIYRVERGVSLVSTTYKRAILARAYGLSHDVITALVEGAMTPEDAAKLVQVDPLAVGSQAGAPSVEAQGDTMAWFVKLDHVRKSGFPGLECCLLFFEMSGKIYRRSTVEAARSGDFGPDRTPLEWKELLDRLEALHDGIRSEGTPATPPTRKP